MPLKDLSFLQAWSHGALSLQPLPVEFLSRGLAWRARCNRTLGSDGVPSLCAAHVGATGHPWLLGLGSVAGGTEEVEF